MHHIAMLPKFLLSMPNETDVDYVLHTDQPSFLIRVDRNDEDQPVLSKSSIIRWYDAEPTQSGVLDAIFEEMTEFLLEEYDFISDEEEWND